MQDKIVLVLSPEDFNSNSQGDWDSSVGISKVANIDTSKLLFLCVCFHLVFIVPHIVLWSIARQSFYLYIFSLLLCVMTSFFPCSLIRGLIIKISLLLLATRSEATVNARFISQQFLRVGTIANISGLRVEQKLATAVSSPVVAYQLYRYKRGVGCPEVILSTREFQTCERA